MRMMMSGAALLALAGCGQQAGPAGGGNAADAAEATFATPNGTGEARTGQSALTGLPDGIPAYPSADTSASIQISGDAAEGEGRIVGFRTSDPPPQVVAFYAAAAERAGFRVSDRLDMGASASMSAQRDNGDMFRVTASPSPGGTLVQVIAGNSRARR